MITNVNMNVKAKTPVRLVLAVLVFLAAVPGIGAQSNTGTTPNEDAVEWPQFAKDIRRFDVISFGVFPFAYLLTGIGYDLIRSAQHDWDTAYYPWPVKGSAEWTSDDYRKVLLGSAIVSLSVAAIDLTIVWIKRRAAGKREEARSRPETEIRRTPLYETYEENGDSGDNGE
jgi:hypothetical protein